MKDPVFEKAFGFSPKDSIEKMFFMAIGERPTAQQHLAITEFASLGHDPNIIISLLRDTRSWPNQPLVPTQKAGRHS